MNKKNKLFLVVILCVILVIVIWITIDFSTMQVSNEVNINDDTEIFEEVNIIGNYIWDSTNERDTWMCFRKKIIINDENNLQNVVAQIAADSKYWLYINDEMVVREGGLKRGEKTDSIYYDEVNISQYLKVGENTISALVWYWGENAISYITSERAAFLFQTKIGEEVFMTDATWKVKKNSAYLQDFNRPNDRLPEENVYYDATLSEDDWYKIDYDDTSWENAIVYGKAGDLPWGELTKRDIPQFKNYEIKEYENTTEYKNYVADKEITLEMQVPYNMQLMPYFKIESPENLKINIKSDTYKDINGDSIQCTYITKSGIQEFEMLPWINGEKIYYTIPKGVKIISLGYRQTSYASEKIGKFLSDDEFFNKLWEMAANTLLVNMRDTYMDCPNRERAQWVGDMNIEMMEALYCLDTNANLLYEKGIKTMEGTNKWGILFSVIPSGAVPTNIPLQSISTINAIYEYYRYTGNKELIKEFYPYAKNYLDLWYITDTGLYKCGISYYVWEWGDSAGGIDYTTLENAWYCLSLLRISQMANVLGYYEDEQSYIDKFENLKSVFNNSFWTENGYISKETEKIDGRANAMAVISGLADKEKYDVIDNVLRTEYEASPYMEYYVLEAMCQMGDIKGARKTHKRQV